MLDFILTLHQYNVYLIFLATAVACIWGFVLYFTKREMIRPWRIMLIVTLVLGVLQALFGIIMAVSGLKPGGGTGLYYLHYVYGGIFVASLPFVWLSFTSNEKNQRRTVLFYSLAVLVMLAVAFRAWMTGPAVFHM